MKVLHLLYNNTVQIEFNDFGHKYTMDGKPLDSVTGITGAINKPQLIQWGVNECVNFLTEKIKPGISFDEVELVGLFNDARKAHTRKRDTSADIGTLVHDWLRRYI